MFYSRVVVFWQKRGAGLLLIRIKKKMAEKFFFWAILYRRYNKIYFSAFWFFLWQWPLHSLWDRKRNLVSLQSTATVQVPNVYKFTNSSFLNFTSIFFRTSDYICFYLRWVGRVGHICHRVQRLHRPHFLVFIWKNGNGPSKAITRLAFFYYVIPTKNFIVIAYASLVWVPLYICKNFPVHSEDSWLKPVKKFT